MALDLLRPGIGVLHQEYCKPTPRARHLRLGVTCKRDSSMDPAVPLGHGPTRDDARAAKSHAARVSCVTRSPETPAADWLVVSRYSS